MTMKFVNKVVRAFGACKEQIVARGAIALESARQFIAIKKNQAFSLFDTVLPEGFKLNDQPTATQRRPLASGMAPA